MNRPLRLCAFLVLLASAAAMRAGDTSREEELNQLFRKYYSAMQVDSALSTLDELIALRHQAGAIEQEGSARWNRIATLNNAARHDSLLSEARVQMEWFKEHAIWRRYYQCWQRVCSANHDLGRMQTALREARAMRDDAQRRDNNTGRAMAYKQMAIIYYDIQQMEQATDAFEHSVELLREDGDDSGILSGVYDGLCQTYDRRKMYDKELETAREWLEHLSVVENRNGIVTVAPVYVSAHLAHAASYLGLQQIDEAKLSLRMAEEYQAKSASALATYYIFEMHTRIALAEDRIGEAIAFTDSTLNSGITVDNKILELRADALLRAGRGAESARLYRSLFEQKDSVFTRDMRSQLDEMNTLFRVDELRKEQQESRMQFIVILSVLVVAVLVFYILLRRRTSKRLEQKNRELAEANEALMRANARAEESSKMKTEFIKNISHEIRTPLNVLYGFTQLLVHPGSRLSQTQKEEMGHRIEDSSARITGLVNKMLELSEASSHTVIDRVDKVLAAEVAHVAATHADAVSAIHFSLNVADAVSEATIVTNLNYAARAVTLLLNNAFKFTKEGTVSLTVDYSADRRYMEYIVEDTGIGIPADQAERIFDEFVQLDEYYEGTGIGLTVARSIVTRLGGMVRLDTHYTGGARFVLSLPV